MLLLHVVVLGMLLLHSNPVISTATTISRLHGDAAFNSGNPHLAISLYRKALESNPLDVQAISNLATALYATSPTTTTTLDQVISLYRRALQLRSGTGNGLPQLHFNLGSALLSRKEHELAKQSFERALELQPSFPAALQNLGVIQQELGSYGGAEELYRRSLDRAKEKNDVGGRIEPRKNLWSLLKAQGRHDALQQSYEEELTITPNDPDIYNDLGALFHTTSTDTNGVKRAIEMYTKAVELDKNHRANANIGLGIVHTMVERREGEDPTMDQKDLHRALFHFRRSLQGSEYLTDLEAKPEGDELYFHGRVSAIERATGTSTDTSQVVMASSCAESQKMRHDAKQLRYILMSSNKLSRGSRQRFLRVAEALEKLVQMTKKHVCHHHRTGNKTGNSNIAPSGRRPALPAATNIDATTTDANAANATLLAHSYRKLLHSGILSYTLTFPSPLNPFIAAHDQKMSSDVYRSRKILVIDNLLTKDALAGLRSWLLKSTIWNANPKENYVGSTMDEGILAHPTMIQLAVELPRAFPFIFNCQARRRLRQAWAYSYHNFDDRGLEQQSGIGLHADESAVNANLWIDDPNYNSKEEGEEQNNENNENNENNNGLVIYAKEAPMEWDFQEYNNDRKEEELTKFLEDSPWYNVKYRNNRLVLFNGNQFHKSMPLKRKGGYHRRRINLTFLFGKRGATCKESTTEGDDGEKEEDLEL